jgi:arylformamidase
MNPIYLSYYLNENTPAYGGEEGSIQLERIRSISKGDTSNNMRFILPGHIGTHIDFPFHFSDIGKKLEHYPADFWLFDKIGLIICSVEDILKEVEKLPADIEMLILKTGFGEKRGQCAYWQSQPVIKHTLAQKLKSLFPKLRVFGFDMISLTSKLNRLEGKLAHQYFLLECDILILEDMDLSSLQTTPTKVIVLPLMIAEADGAPCAVIAF